MDGAKALIDVESTFDIVYTRISRDWRQRDDIATPFNDRRWSHVESVWTFDLDGDILRLDKQGHRLWVPLDLIRRQSISMSDFKPHDAPLTLAKHSVQSVHSLDCWKMKRKDIDMHNLERHKIFVSRILADFAHQWRHVLCGRYNDYTFRRLAFAIVSIVTLDFTVEEVTRSRAGTGIMVWINSLPEWDFARGHIFRVGGVSIVICQHAPHAVTLIRNDFAKRRKHERVPANKSFTYLILSVRELILYRTNDQFHRCTEPTRLLDGIHPPSDEAVEILLQATQTRAPDSPLHKLPLELQDAVLDEVSAGPIESARVGCLLGIGSTFRWRCGNRNIEREGVCGSRTPWSRVESHICFGGHRSGVAYK